MNKDNSGRDSNTSTRLGESTQPWYHAGLRFVCTGCGVCCSGAGRVWLSDEEITRLGVSLSLSTETFVDQYVDRDSGRWALKEDPRTGDCTFLRETRCTIYEARPRQCRTFPWWPSTLESEARWRDTARSCEGIDHSEAPLISIDEIRAPLREEINGRKRRR